MSSERDPFDLWFFVRENIFVIVAAIGAIAFLAAGRVTWRDARAAIDTDLLLVLFALLVAVEVLRESGYLDAAVAESLSRFQTARAFAIALIVLTGALACLITNDVALFVVIPFTVIAGRRSDFDVEDAVILEVAAANLLGCLTPLGNPQNLFAYHRSGWAAGRFVATMVPFVGIGLAGLLAAVFILKRSRPLERRPVVLPPLRHGYAAAGALCFALVLLEIARVTNAVPAAVAALLVATFVLRRRALRIDYSILPLFFFAFIVVAGLHSLDVYGVLREIPLATARARLYVSSIALSQIFSNVPTTVLLSPLAGSDWKTLLWGANAGGCGTIIASLANLLGWRIYVRESNRDPRFFRRLTIVSFALLGWMAVGGWVLL